MKIVNGVGQGVALEEQALNYEGVGVNGAIARGTNEIVGAFGREIIKIDGPEIPIAPFFDWTGVLRGNDEHGFLVTSVVQSATGELIRGSAQNDGVFRSGRFIAEVIGEDFGFVGTSEERTWQENDASEADTKEWMHGEASVGNERLRQKDTGKSQNVMFNSIQ